MKVLASLDALQSCHSAVLFGRLKIFFAKLGFLAFTTLLLETTLVLARDRAQWIE